jgi:hypothetical protein
MRTTIAGVIATLALFGSTTALAAEPPREAATMKTVFVDKGSASSVTKAVNALHAKMEADGWVVQNVSVYTEDGDLEGLFVTYVRKPVVPAAPAALETPTP